MDNDSKHRSHDSKDLIEDNSLDVPRDWPSYSPDLNPIKNLWGLLAKKIQEKTLLTKTDLKKFLREAWRQIATQELCESLVVTMPNRLLEVRARLGEKIDY